MQVIAGKYRSRKLHSIEEKSTRPTLARVKGSLFDIIEPYIASSVVLDLFAGSGALGLEALSRGAKEVFFVENNSKAIKVIEKNLERVTEDYKIINADYVQALNSFKGRQKFDLVLLDPPYASDFAEKSIALLARLKLLNKGAKVVIEQESKKVLQNYENEYIMIKTRSYGLMKVTILEYIGE